MERYCQCRKPLHRLVIAGSVKFQEMNYSQAVTIHDYDHHHRAEDCMSIELDHLLVPSRDRIASAQCLAGLLGVRWSKSGLGPFSPVYVNDGLTLDFDETKEPFPKLHFCFRVDQSTFEAILGRIRAAGLAYRSTPHGPVDWKINTEYGGSIVYWSEPDGHVWEILTESYARSRD